MMQFKFIAIEGNIGAGKTTLAKLLAKHFNARLILEAFDDNPFLPSFYKDAQQFAFPLELFFMAERYKQLKEWATSSDLFQPITVVDYLFAKCLLFAKINLPEEEFALYQRFFNIIQPQLIHPDVLIFLQAPVGKLQENIKKRNRSYEQGIADDYLLNIQNAYAAYLQQHAIKSIYVDVTHANFLENPAHLQTILNSLNDEQADGSSIITLS
jgi:deoxyguanosine kinase